MSRVPLLRSSDRAPYTEEIDLIRAEQLRKERARRHEEKLLAERIEKEKQKHALLTCQNCLITRELLTLTCGHVFCRPCLSNPSCPTCQAEIAPMCLEIPFYVILVGLSPACLFLVWPAETVGNLYLRINRRFNYLSQNQTFSLFFAGRSLIPERTIQESGLRPYYLLYTRR